MSGGVEIPTEYAMLPVYRIMRDQGKEPPAQVRASAAQLHDALDRYMAENYPGVRSVTTSGGVLLWSRAEQPSPPMLYGWGGLCAGMTTVNLACWGIWGGPFGWVDLTATAFTASVGAVIWTVITRQRRRYRLARWARAIP